MKCLVDIYTVDILPQHKTEFNRVSSSHVWRGVFSNLFTCVKSFTFTDLLLKFKLSLSSWSLYQYYPPECDLPHY